MSEPEPGAKIVILLAVYNGAAFLRDQLNSFAAQDQADWCLIASDDGSSDDSLTILADFARAHPSQRIEARLGPCNGFYRNFMSLLSAVPKDADFAALSDQDDIWFPDKLTRATARLAAVPKGTPAIYAAATEICDEDLSPRGPSEFFPRPPSFRNALVQSIGGGNTMVLNRAAITLVQRALTQVDEIVVHDWWLYQIVSGSGGQVIRDNEPVLKYRQHGGNLIGSNTSIRAKVSRFWFVMTGRFISWNRINLAALNACRDLLTEDARSVLTDYSQVRSGSVLNRLRGLSRSGVYRQDRAGTVALWLACALGRL